LLAINDMEEFSSQTPKTDLFAFDAGSSTDDLLDPTLFTGKEMIAGRCGNVWTKLSQNHKLI
jgi:hypothetical protein